jgi:hypothetical protein
MHPEQSLAEKCPYQIEIHVLLLLLFLSQEAALWVILAG